MSAINEFAGRVKTQFVDLGQSVDGIASDVASMKALIEKLQNSPGQITPEDQATLDELEAQFKAHTDKVKALDDATAPVEVPTP